MWIVKGACMTTVAEKRQSQIDIPAIGSGWALGLL